MADLQTRVTVPRRTAEWGRRVRWARRGTQAVVVGFVAWQVAGHVRNGAASGEALCPFGGFETLWTYVTTGRMVQHTQPASLVLAVAVIVLALTSRGAFCGWLCPFGAFQEWLHTTAQAVADRVPPLRRVRRAITVRSNGRAWRGDRPGAADGPLGGLSPGRSSGRHLPASW